MIRIGLVGIGRMGSYHFDMYEKLMDAYDDIQLVAICDVDPQKLNGKHLSSFNMGASKENRELETYRTYTSVDEMLAKEQLDMVDVVVPTYLHKEIAVKVLNSGRHCMCEKPMALNPEECQEMLDAAQKNHCLLMIGQCLHFWREYAYLHEMIQKCTLGKLKSLQMWRGGAAHSDTNPSWQNWIIDVSKGGGGLFDQHIHDSDFIRWTLGDPAKVVSFSRDYFPLSKNDIVVTNYVYPDMVVTAEDNISYQDFPFGYGYVADFEDGTIKFEKEVTVYPKKQEPFQPVLDSYGTTWDSYYNELEYFLNCIRSGSIPERCRPEDAMATVALVRKEEASAEENRV